MKTRYLWILLFTISFISCDDNTGGLGIDMLPPTDQLKVGTELFDYTTKSIIPERVYAKTGTGYIGRYTDPEFGYFESSFLTQINCTDDYHFYDVYDPNKQYTEDDALNYYMAEGKIKSTHLHIYYSSFFGDSLNASRMSVYELNKRLDKDYYSDMDPMEYYSENDLLAQKVYTAYDPTLSQGMRDTLGSHRILIDLPQRVGQDAYEKYLINPGYFANSDAFIDNVFKGVYIKSDYGDGTVLYVDQVMLSYTVDCFRLDSVGNDIFKKKDGTDSIFTMTSYFASTKEVIQLNRFQNSDKLIEKANEKDWTYIKSPAGIFTQVTLPIQEIADKLAGDTLNAVKLVFDEYSRKDDSGDFAMSGPSRLLLIRENEMESFFEENKIIDNVTSYMYPAVGASRSSSQFIFSNISYLINYCINEKKEAAKKAGDSWNEAEWIKETKWDKVLLVPIIITDDGASSPTLISISNDLRPTYTKLKGGENNVLELETHYTYFQD